MNRWDVVAAALTHAIPPERLHLAAVRAGAHATRHWIATNLSTQPPAEVLVDGGRLELGERGFTGFESHGGQTVEVSWDEIAACLLAVVTPDLVDDLDPATDAALDCSMSAPRGVDRARRRLAHRVARANALALPSMFADALSERTVADDTDGGWSWRGRITLNPVEPDIVECQVNGHVVVRLAAGAAPYLVEVSVLTDTPLVAEKPADSPTLRRIVYHQQSGEHPRFLPPCFADRVAAGGVSYGPGGPFWSVQVDDVPVVFLNADGITPVENVTVRWSVYDHGHDPYHHLEPQRGRCTLRRSPGQASRDTAVGKRRWRLRRNPDVRGR